MTRRSTVALGNQLAIAIVLVVFGNQRHHERAGPPVFVIWFGPAPGTMLPPPAISGPILAAVAALALVVDRPRFARRTTTQAPLELESAPAR